MIIKGAADRHGGGMWRLWVTQNPQQAKRPACLPRLWEPKPSKEERAKESDLRGAGHRAVGAREAGLDGQDVVKCCKLVCSIVSVQKQQG